MCEEIYKDDKDEKINECIRSFRDHGLGCGNKIADIAKEIHSHVLAIVPLYRSCMVVEQSDEEKKDGVCTLHSYADPHWLGGEIDIDTLKLDDFHHEFSVKGDRQGFVIIDKNAKEDDDQRGEDKDSKVLEHDEN